MTALSFVLLTLAAVPIAVDEADLAERYVEGQALTWVFEVNGLEIGKHSLRYDGAVSYDALRAHRFTSWTELQSGLGTQRLHVSHLVDDDGHAIQHTLSVIVGDTLTRVDCRAGDGRVEAHVDQGQGVQQHEIELEGPHYYQANNVIGAFDILFVTTPITPMGFEARLFAGNSLQPLPYSARFLEWTDEGGARLADSLGETLTLDAEGHLIALRVPSAGLLVERRDIEPLHFEVPERRRADRPRYELVSEDVTLTHGETTLAGTITRPVDAEGRLPALTFLSGSGPQDRNGMSNGIDLGTREILDRLSHDGFLVLRVDDRNVGHSRGPTGAGLTGLVEDALACVDHLLARDDVDPARVGLIGHSEGATTGPIVATRRPLAALVLLAGVGRPLHHVMLDQNRLALADAGLGEDDIEELLVEIAATFERLASGEELGTDDLPEEYHPLIAGRRWFREHARHDPLGVLAQVDCPVLVLQGELDFQVSPEEDTRRLIDALDAADADYEAIVFPRLDHLFKRVPGERSTMADYMTDRPVDPAVLATLSAWLRDTLAVGSER